MEPMETTDYDVWYDPNEIDATNHVQVLRGWARADLDITMGKVIRIGDDELDPLPARIVAFDSATGIITLEVLFAIDHAAVA
jgi:hypothetical protein